MSQKPDTSDIEDDISVGDNRSDTSTPIKNYNTKLNYKTNESNDHRNELNINNRLSFDDAADEFENRDAIQLSRMKLYDNGIFQLYRPDRASNKDECTEMSSAFDQIPSGSLSNTIYGRSMDLSKGSFQSQLLAGFAASVIASNSHRENPNNTGNPII